MHRRGFALVVVVLATVMDLLDGTVVNIVVPSIQRELDAGTAAAGWIAASYTLALGALLTVGGRLGDLYGHRRVLVVGTAGFVAASLGCGLATSPGVLAAARGAQGAMAAVMVPQTLAVIQLLYPPEERGRAMSVFAAVAGVATVGGPVVGAVVTQADVVGLGWRAVFLLNLPLGALVLAGARVLPASRPGSRTGSPRLPGVRTELDLAGVGLLVVGLLALMVPLLQASEAGWEPWTGALLAAAVGILAVFVAREHRRSRRDLPVLLHTGLLRIRGFAGAVLVVALVYATVFGLFFTLALYLQRGLGWSPLASAVTVLPWAVGIPLTSTPAARWLVPRFGRRVLEVGVVALATGLAGTATMVTVAPTVSGVWPFVPGLLVAGCGMGLVIAPVLSLGLVDVPGQWAGTASGLINNTQQLAGAVGVAGAAAVYFSALGATPGAASDPVGTTAAFRLVVWCLVGLAAAAVPAVRLLPDSTTRAG